MTDIHPKHSGRLNAFQRVMCNWSLLHPYNATHTYKLAGPVRLDALREAIRGTFADHGLGIAEISPDGRTYTLETDDQPEVQVLDGGKEPEARLTELLTRELNHRFPRPRCQPFRFAVTAAGSAHYLTTTYDHWVADSVTARLILRHVLGRYLNLAIPGNETPLELYQGTYRDAFGRRLRGWQLLGAIGRSFRMWRRNRSDWLVPYSSIEQMAVQCEFHRTAHGTVGRLRQFARDHGATVHDVILAAIARSIAEFLPRKTVCSRRGCLALGTIVDTRADAEQDVSEVLGNFLSYYLTRCRTAECRNLAEMTEQVAAMTGPIKHERRFLDALVSMKFITGLWPWVKESTKPRLMRRAIPMAGGVSNVVIHDDWIDRYGRGRILDYFRAAPTGPSLPLVFAPTTFGNEMTVGLTYRITGFSSAKMAGIMAMFLDQIEHPEGHVYHSVADVAAADSPAAESEAA